jgi:hypothetical protein
MYMYFEHYANLFQANLNHNKIILFGSIYSNRRRNPTLPSQNCVRNLRLNTSILTDIALLILSPFNWVDRSSVWSVSLLWSRLIWRIETPFLLYNSTQSTRSNYGIVTLLKTSNCKASLPINANFKIPTNTHHIQNLARYFKFCTNTRT